MESIIENAFNNVLFSFFFEIPFTTKEKEIIVKCSSDKKIYNAYYKILRLREKNNLDMIHPDWVYIKDFSHIKHKKVIKDYLSTWHEVEKELEI